MTTSHRQTELSKDAAAGKRFAIAVSRYHEEISRELLTGTVSRLEALGAKKDHIQTVWVPGSFELPLAARAFAEQEFDAIICLGVIVKGGTNHDEYIADAAARGIAQVGQASGMPV